MLMPRYEPLAPPLSTVCATTPAPKRMRTKVPKNSAAASRAVPVSIVPLPLSFPERLSRPDAAAGPRGPKRSKRLRDFDALLLDEAQELFGSPVVQMGNRVRVHRLQVITRGFYLLARHVPTPGAVRAFRTMP